MLPHTLCHHALLTQHKPGETKLFCRQVARKPLCVNWYTPSCRKCIALKTRYRRIAKDSEHSSIFAGEIQLHQLHTHDCIMHPFCTRLQTFFVGPHTSMTCNAHLYALSHTHVHPSSPSQVCRRAHKSCRHPRLRAINPTTELTYKHRCRSGRESYRVNRRPPRWSTSSTAALRSLHISYVSTPTQTSSPTSNASSLTQPFSAPWHVSPFGEYCAFQKQSPTFLCRRFAVVRAPSGHDATLMMRYGTGLQVAGLVQRASRRGNRPR